MVEQNSPILVNDALGIFAGPDEAKKAVVQSGSLKRALAAASVNIEQPSLLAGIRGGLGFVDGGIDPVSMKDAGKHEAAKASTNNGCSLSHRCAPLIAASFEAGGLFGDARQPCSCMGGVYAAVHGVST
ncbi:hypothetical protein D9M70_440190 [compost metagenome]